ncbi:MAG: hypothetical protein IK093_06580 [Ruminiclostridium sp.]|nr:hypothetical protein [Ruminiclostridium sp.]
MKTDVYSFEKDVENIDIIAEVAEKIAAYNGLDHKQTLKLSLFCEELVEMLPKLLVYGGGEFWIENNGANYEIHARVQADSMLSSLDRDEILAVSTSGKNAAAVGIMNKIRIAAEVFSSNYASSAGSTAVSFPDSHYTYYNMGIDPADDALQWSLSSYKAEAKKNEEAWDELEKSIIANMADDVTVGIINGEVEIVVKKKF